MIFRAGIHKMLDKLANREDPELHLRCLSMPFWRATYAHKMLVKLGSRKDPDQSAPSKAF